MVKKLKLKTIGIWIVFLFLVIILFSSLSQPLLHRSWGLKMVQGPSMEPVFNSGDLVFVIPYIIEIHEKPKIGDIIVFEASTDEGFKQMMAHRINEIKDGRIYTKGDNVQKTDQEGGGWKPLSENEIQGIIPQIAGQPIVIPKLGGLINDYWLYIIIGVSAIIIIILINNSNNLKISMKKTRLEKRRNMLSFYSQHEREFTYLILFLVFTISIMFLFSSGWQSEYLSYDVSESSTSGIFGSRGSNLGILKVGTEKNLPLNFTNELPIPIVVVIVSDDPYIKTSEKYLAINHNEKKETQVTVTATNENIGHKVSMINIIKYPGFLPAEIIAKFTKISIPLTMFLISCFPVGIITFIFYVLDRKINRK
jgi:signal peptidase I